MGLLNYVPYLLLCHTCLVPYVLSCPTYLVSYILSYPTWLVPYVPLVLYVLSCPLCSTCSGVLRALVPCTICALVPYVHRVLCALVPYVVSYHTCSRALFLMCFFVSIVLLALVPHLSYMFLYLTCLLPWIFLGCSWLGLYGTCAPEFWIVRSRYCVYSILQEIFNTESDLIMCFNLEWQESGN